MFSVSNIHYEIDGRHKGIASGGIGAIRLMNKKLGFIEEIDDLLHLLKLHLPYHESDHVLNIAYINWLLRKSVINHIEPVDQLHDRARF